MNKFNFCEVVDVISGGTPSTKIPEYWDGNIPWLSVVDFGDKNKYVFDTEKHISQVGVDNSATKILKKGDIIISARGTVGAMAVLSRPMAFNQSCFGLRAKSEIMNQDYLFYFLKSFMHNISQKSQGSVFATINLDTFKSIEMEVPDMKQQEAISGILSAIDDSIENNTAICFDLEALAMLFYDYWFVQFDFPDESGKPYKSSGGKMVWNEELKREIPEGWEVSSIGSVLSLLKDGTHNPPKRIPKGIPLLTGTMFGDMFLDYSQVTYISEEDFKKIHSQYAPRESDIILTKIGTLGNVNILRHCDIPIAIHCNSALLRFPDYMTGMFAYSYCRSEEFQKRLRAEKGQSVQEFCSLESISAVKMLLPCKELIIRYNIMMKSTMDKLKNLSEENQQLIELRDFLLPMLMNRQVIIKEN